MTNGPNGWPGDGPLTSPPVSARTPVPAWLAARRTDARVRFGNWRGEAVQQAWDRVTFWGAIGAHSRRAERFGAFGQGSIMMFPWVSLYNERYMRIGADTMIGQQCALAVGMADGQQMLSDPVISIGDRCLIGKGNGIVAHWGVHIGDDVFTGHNVYITDQNHGYEDLDRPIGAQTMPEKAVHIGSGSWLGHGVVVLPGVTIGEHVTVAAGSVVTKDLPDRCVAAGNPARVIRFHDGEAWVRPPR